MKKFLIFCFIYLINTILLFYTEYFQYFDIYSSILGYKLNFYTNSNNKFNLRLPFIFTIIIIILLFLQYYYIIKENKSLLEGFLFGCLLITLCNINLFACSFDKVITHLPIIIYDILILGGLSMVMSQYLIYNYYELLEKNIIILIIFFILCVCWFLYYCYLYNPDLIIL